MSNQIAIVQNLQKSLNHLKYYKNLTNQLENIVRQFENKELSLEQKEKLPSIQKSIKELSALCEKHEADIQDICKTHNIQMELEVAKIMNDFKI